MIAIMCVDDHNGILFNNRRQSRDKMVQNHILNMTYSSKIWMNHFSSKQFPEINNIIIDENFFEKAESGDYCFVENIDIEPYIHKIEKIIIFKWNRTYPADTYFSLDLSEWILEDTEEFKGHSHDKITKEIYRK